MSEKIAVVGSGQMGNGIAHVFAVAGFDVTMIDVSRAALDRARATIEKNLGRQVEKKILDAPARDAALARIATNESLQSAADAALIVEAATEKAELKFALFADLDRIANPAAILASNTSSISITEIARARSASRAVIGMHFMNPVPVMELVEIIRGLATSNETTGARCSPGAARSARRPSR
jgi:3-hydroxybutyryl-CoA dehydrogenase